MSHVRSPHDGPVAGSTPMSSTRTSSGRAGRPTRSHGHRRCSSSSRIAHDEIRAGGEGMEKVRTVLTAAESTGQLSTYNEQGDVTCEPGEATDDDRRREARRDRLRAASHRGLRNADGAHGVEGPERGEIFGAADARAAADTPEHRLPFRCDCEGPGRAPGPFASDTFPPLHRSTIRRRRPSTRRSFRPE